MGQIFKAINLTPNQFGQANLYLSSFKVQISHKWSELHLLPSN